MILQNDVSVNSIADEPPPARLVVADSGDRLTSAPVNPAVFDIDTAFIRLCGADQTTAIGWNTTCSQNDQGRCPEA